MTYSPLLLSHSMSSLEVLPTSLASAETRAFATFLLRGPRGFPQAVVSALLHLCGRCSSVLAHRALIVFVPSRRDRLVITASRSGSRSNGPSTRNARPSARRRSASARHSGSGCRCAPRPGIRPRRSGINRRISPVADRSTTMRSRSDLAARLRQPTHVRSGSARLVTSRY